ncbi:unnamed protein product [Tilletia controversa]|nr:unnamed protein product [Tilletia controversa]
MRVIDTLLLAAAALSSSSLLLAAPASGTEVFNNDLGRNLDVDEHQACDHQDHRYYKLVPCPRDVDRAGHHCADGHLHRRHRSAHAHYRRSNQVMNADGTFFGYFGPVSGDYGATSVTDSADNALVVSIRPSISGLINIINPSGSSFPYLGTVMGTDRQNSANDIGPGLFNYIIIGNVNKVDAGTQSTDMTQNSLTSSGAPPAVYESRVWSYDPDTGSLQLTWTNSDGSSVSNPTLIAFQAQGATFFEFTGDEAAYRTRYDGFLTQNLNLIFVPNV